MRTQENNTSPLADFSLSPAAQALVRLAVQSPGNQLNNVEEVARTEVRATQRGGCPQKEEDLRSSARKKAAEQQHLAEAERRARRTEPKVKVEGQMKPQGFAWWLLLMTSLIGLLALLWIENGAAAQALLSVGAFDVDTFEKARYIMTTPIGVGIALIFAFKVLPPFVRRPMFLTACCLLGAIFLTWAVCFAIRSEMFRGEAGQGISLSEEDASEPPAEEGNVTGWLMLGCWVSLMCLTTFIGHVGLEHLLHSRSVWETNPDLTRALDDAKVHAHEIGKHEAEMGRLSRELADMKAEEERAVVQARTLYLYLRGIEPNLERALSHQGEIRPDSGPVPAALKPQPVSPAPGNAAAMPTVTPFRDQAA